jgi:hypothetical protein
MKTFQTDGTREIEYVIIEDFHLKKISRSKKLKMDGRALSGSVVYNSQNENDTFTKFQKFNNVVEFIVANSVRYLYDSHLC